MLEGEPSHGPERRVKAKLTLKTTRVYISKVEITLYTYEVKKLFQDRGKKRITSNAFTLPASMLNFNIAQTSRFVIIKQ